jgi:hypothetical protein
MPALDQVNTTVGGRAEDRVRHLGQRVPITLGKFGSRRAVPDQEAAVVLELLAAAGTLQPAVEGDARGVARCVV